MNAKERRIEVPEAVIVAEEVSSTGDDAASSLWVGVVPFVDVEAVSWYVRLC
jgi:hypothetical protein